MPFDGNGNFTNVYNWTNDYNNHINVRADRMDSQDSDIATGLSTALTKDGQTTPTANLPMGGFHHTSVSNASARNHYAAAGQIQDGSLTWCGTAGGTANAITVTTTPATTAYVAGSLYSFVSSAANTGAVTVNANAIGAKSLVKNGTTALLANDIPSGAIVRIQYDGTNFQLLSILPPLGAYTEKLQALGSITGAVTVDLSQGNHISATLTGAVTFTFSDPSALSPVAQPIVFYLKQDGTGSRVVTWPASVIWAGAVAPTLTTTASRTDEIVLLTKDGGSHYSGSVRGLNYNY